MGKVPPTLRKCIQYIKCKSIQHFAFSGICSQGCQTFTSVEFNWLPLKPMVAWLTKVDVYLSGCFFSLPIPPTILSQNRTYLYWTPRNDSPLSQNHLFSLPTISHLLLSSPLLSFFSRILSIHDIFKDKGFFLTNMAIFGRPLTEWKVVTTQLYPSLLYGLWSPLNSGLLMNT